MSLFTGARVHKHRVKPMCTAKAKAVVDAVTKLMGDELSTVACERWRSRLNAELGNGLFTAAVDVVESDDTPPVPRVWVPSKPELTLALIDQIEKEIEWAIAPQACVGAAGSLRKIVARLAVDRMRAAKGEEWLKACGEISAEQCCLDAKLMQVLSKVALNLLVFVHARAKELAKEEGLDCWIELHSSRQSLGGKEMRGCGVVFCDVGGEVVQRALALVRKRLSSHLVT